MKKKLFRRRLYDILECLALLAAATALVIFPTQSVNAASDGLTLCLNVIIPSLFPFFTLSSLIVNLGLAKRLGRFLEPVMRPLFNVSGACSTAFVLGFVGGYPVGAKTVISLYDDGSCTKSEAERLLSFCNNSGPAFIFGVVGAGVFSSSKAGLLIYLSHTAASILIGVLFRKWGDSSHSPGINRAFREEPKRFTTAFTQSVKSSFMSTLNICGFVIFFTVFIKMLFISGFIPFLSNLIGSVFGPLGFDSAWAESLLTGFLELTSGVWTLKDAAGSMSASMAMAAFMLGWAGLSVHCQVLSFIGESDLSAKTYIIGKLLHGIISALFMVLLAEIFMPDTAASVFLAEQVTGIASLSFFKAASISCAGAVGLFIIAFAASKIKKRNGSAIKR